MNDDATDPQPAYELDNPDRPASAEPTERLLEDESSPRAHDPYAALQYRDYWLFSGGWMLSVIGSQLTASAINWEIYDRTHSPSAIGLAAGIQVIPLALLALPAGALADMFDRRRIIQTTNLLAMIFSLLLASQSYGSHSVSFMYLLLLGLSTMQTLGRPARSAMLPQLVPREVFNNAVTWNSSIFQISIIAGQLIGSGVNLWSLRRLHSLRLAYTVDACCAFTFVCMILFVRRPFAQINATPKKSEPMLQRLLAGVQYVRKKEIILATMTLDLFAVLLGGAVYLLPVFVKDVLHIGADPAKGAMWYSLLKLADGCGAFVMAIILAHRPPMKRAGRTMLIAVAGFGLATIAFGLSRNYWFSFAMLVVVGACDSISVVVRHTLVQVLTPDEMRGRVSAVNNVFIGTSNELGGMESGYTAKWFGPIVSVVGGGIGTLLVVLAVSIKWPQVRKFGSLHDAKPSDG
jgi:MFS family permease